MEKTGIDYLPRRTYLSSLEKECMRRFGGLKAYGFINMLENRIACPGSDAFYLKIHKSTYEEIAQDFKCDTSYVRSIIRFLVDNNYFNKNKFIKYNILTNEQIQTGVLVKVYGVAKRLEFGKIRMEYILSSIIPKLAKTPRFIGFFEEFNQKNKEIRQDKIIKDITLNKEREEKDFITTNKKTISLSSKDKLALFKSKFPKVPIGNEFLEIPEFVDINLLLEKYEQSPQWLQTARNITLAWACQEKNYKKIITDCYKKITTEKNIRRLDPKNDIGRNYTKEQLDKIFKDLQDVELD